MMEFKTFKIPPQQKKDLCDLARIRGVTASRLIRDGVTIVLEQHKEQLQKRVLS